jgi:XRE family transcriptional regulator, regulator of sulfur utilization
MPIILYDGNKVNIAEELMCNISKNISKNLKGFRKSRQLTLEELAEKSGVSKSMLGEIERGRTNPTITVLWKITQALKMPLTTLIGNQNEPYVLVRKNDRAPLNLEPDHTISSIFPFYEPHRMEVLHIDLTPKSKLNNEGHIKGVEEYIFVLDGSVNIAVHDEEVTLHSGDSMRFAADSSHTIDNITEHHAKLLNIIHYI